MIIENYDNWKQDLELWDNIEEGAIKQVLGWTLFTPLSIYRVIHQLVMKERKIKSMLKKEKDPKKRDKLRQELKNMKYEQVKYRKKLQKQELKGREQAKKAKETMTPEEKKKLAKQTAKTKEKIDKAKEKMKDLETRNLGLV